MLARERQRAFARKHDVWRFLHYTPCDADRIDDIHDCGDRSCFLTLAVHDRSIEFDVACCIGRGTTACDVQTAGLHCRDSVLDNIESTASSCKPAFTLCGQFAQMCFHNNVVTTGDSAGSTV